LRTAITPKDICPVTFIRILTIMKIPVMQQI